MRYLARIMNARETFFRSRLAGGGKFVVVVVVGVAASAVVEIREIGGNVSHLVVRRPRAASEHQQATAALSLVGH